MKSIYTKVFLSIGGIFFIWFLASVLIFLLTPGSLFLNKVSWASVPNYGYEQKYLELENGQKVSLFKFEEQNKQDKPVILYLHGNTGRIIKIINDLRGEGFDVYSPAYPGYSESEGSPSPKLVFETALKTYDYMINELGIREDNIIIFGHSMGGSPATYLASQKPNARKLVLANTFSSVGSMCARSYSIFCIFTGSIFNTRSYAKNVTIPVSQFAYRWDTNVPFEEGQRLNSGFINSKQNKFIELDGYTHTDINIDQIKSELN